MDAENQPASSDERARRIRQIVCAYLERLEAGEVDSTESLIQENPDLMPELGEELRRARQQAERTQSFQQPAPQGSPQDRPNSPSSGSALRIRCPHCHSPIQVVFDASLDDIVCSTCGSHFSITGETRSTRAAPSISQVGRFELVERIGIGAFGTVWKARDPELDRTVAVKIPRKGEMTPDEIERFLREARAIAGLRHPNIVSVHEIGRQKDTVFIVADFVRGVSLADLLTGQRLSFREAAQLCSLIGEALHHAHEAGVIHRDLKPANILIDGEMQPHITDFGLAKREAREITITRDGQSLGTPAYMSPEQAAGKSHEADARSDVYSLGVILFELLTGELPFRGNREMLAFQVMHEEPPRPRKFTRNIPRDLETICLKCIEKAPARRYPTAWALALDIRRWSEGQPIRARPAGRLERAWRWCKRQPTVAALSGMLFVSLIVAICLAILERQRAVESADNAAKAEKGWKQAEANAKAAIEARDSEARARIEAEEYGKKAETSAKEAIEAKNREILARVDSLLPVEVFSRTEVGYLQAELRAADQRYKEVHARYTVGGKGGSADALARAEYRLCFAKARVAWAKADVTQCQQECDAAIAACQRRLNAVKAAYDSGTEVYGEVLDAEAALADARLFAGMAQRRIAAIGGPPPQETR